MNAIAAGGDLIILARAGGRPNQPRRNVCEGDLMCLAIYPQNHHVTMKAPQPLDFMKFFHRAPPWIKIKKSFSPHSPSPRYYQHTPSYPGVKNRINQASHSDEPCDAALRASIFPARPPLSSMPWREPLRRRPAQ